MQYQQWLCHLPEGILKLSTAPSRSPSSTSYIDEISSPEFGGYSAGLQMRRLQKVMRPVMQSAMDLKARALRWDAGAILTLSRYLDGLIQSGKVAGLLQGPFSKFLEIAGVQNKFLRRLLDLECFMLSGLDAEGTIAAEMSFMFGERQRPGATIDYPIGGTVSIVNALTMAGYQ